MAPGSRYGPGAVNVGSFPTPWSLIACDVRGTAAHPRLCGKRQHLAEERAPACLHRCEYLVVWSGLVCKLFEPKQPERRWAASVAAAAAALTRSLARCLAGRVRTGTTGSRRRHGDFLCQPARSCAAVHAPPHPPNTAHRRREQDGSKRTEREKGRDTDGLEHTSSSAQAADGGEHQRRVSGHQGGLFGWSEWCFRQIR